MRRELEQLEKRLKADKAKVERECKRLDEIRVGHVDDIISKVGARFCMCV